MPKKLTVAVLAGGKTAEREVSLKSGAAVIAALKVLGHRVIQLDPAKDLAKLIKLKNKIDVVFPALHGHGGEDGAIQGLLELLGLPYVGSGIRPSAQAFHKPTTKQIYAAAGLPIAKGIVIPESNSELRTKNLELKFPCFVKPVADGSSFGASKVTKKSELLSALQKAWEYGDALVEELLDGREITVGVLDLTGKPRALPIVEIVSKTAFFDFQAKYDPNYSTEICPAVLPKVIAKKAGELAIRAHTALGCRDLSRTDMFVVGQKLYLLETNTLPGMTGNSLLPKMARAAGIEFPQLIEQLLRVALQRKT
jgi:D-alanine-D-alanine ligase